MSERFVVKEVFISPVNLTNEGNIRIDLNYPTRFCVIDNENEIAIDIKTKLKYDYLKTISNLYVINKMKNQINDNKRVAIFSHASIFPIEYDIKEVQDIIERLKNNEKFQDGNIVFDNKQYLEYIKQEEMNELVNQVISQNTKKLRKRLK